MIKHISINNFKGFKKFEIEMSNLNILVGPNNAGKTTIFHALQLFFYAIDKISSEQGSKVILTKTQTSDIMGVPFVNVKDIFYNQRLREGRHPVRLMIGIEIDGLPSVEVEIYQAFSTNFMINGFDKELTKTEYAGLLEYRPVLIPSTIGVTSKEDLYREVAQELYISEGRHNEIIRNMIYRISNQPNWTKFRDIINKLFRLKGIEVPFDESKDLWLTTNYKENDVQLDIISGGSGFLQVLNILCFLFVYSKRKLALIDEPDAHMHEDLQRVLYRTLSDVSTENGIQLMIATHSQIFINESSLESIHLIDNSKNKSEQISQYNDLIPFFLDNGLTLPAPKIVEIVKYKKIVFVEGKDSDYDNFIKEFGRIIDSDYEILTRSLVPISTGGETCAWPFESISLFKTILGESIDYVYIADRDLCTDDQIHDKLSRAESENEKLYYLKYRNRECYLLNVRILSAVFRDIWDKYHSGEPEPAFFEEDEIHAYIMNKANELRDETQATFTQYQAKYTRDRDPNAEKENLIKSSAFFNEHYTDILNNDQIPLRLLDGKRVLRELRKHVADKFKISFNDKDIFRKMIKTDIPDEIETIITKIIEMS